MIIIGYQGVGKSTCAANDINFIDLESSNFWITVDGHTYREPTWYIAYCNLAQDLSSQDYDVFVSSHECVRKQLQSSSEHVVAVVPAIALKEQWLERLRNRYELTHKEKDMKALLNAEDRYEANIEEIKRDCDHIIEITNMKDNLGTLIHEYQYNLRRGYRACMKNGKIYQDMKATIK